MIATDIKNTRLFIHLQADHELSNTVMALREVAGKLAESISRTVPTFTDHSISHMDALWSIADHVLTPQELETLTTGESFLLGCGFYLHDIGMAYASTTEGLTHCRESSSYKSFLASIPEDQRDQKYEAQAVAIAVRENHSRAALELATSPIPGTERFLFETTTIREGWGQTCGQIAASHNWDLDDMDREFGRSGIVPLPGRRQGDLGYVASILRIIDYAHINRDRASTIGRVLRQPMASENLIHWLAQENIDGPVREGNDLIYRSAQPLKDVDAWWLYFEMLTGLDNEIRAVRDYLNRRPNCQGRFSLQTVRGASSPREASTYIKTDGFDPIEINLRTGSIDRLVQLLAGESLYGPDPMTTVRELIQNARDAVMLKKTIATDEIDQATLSIPIKLALRREGDCTFLEIKDWGVGMTSKVITDYLLSIASDYWGSQFHIDFPNASDKNFQPAGKFGIGFLSVFMLGDKITVESNRSGGERIRLVLHGVGRRGELRKLPQQAGSGTVVRLRLRETVLNGLRGLSELVKVYAPMLPHPLQIEEDSIVTEIETGWLSKLSPEAFKQWFMKAAGTLKDNREGTSLEDRLLYRHFYNLRRHAEQSSWPLGFPEFVDFNTRLLASFEGFSILCLKGISLQLIRTPGFIGVINLDDAIPDVSRRRALQADIDTLLEQAKIKTSVDIIRNLDTLVNDDFLVNQMEFIDTCIKYYGFALIFKSTIPWISIFKIPGDIQLLNSAAFVKHISTVDSLFIAFNTGPWTAMKLSKSFDPPFRSNEVAVVIKAAGYSTAVYEKEEKNGSLLDLWPEYDKAHVFYAILQLISNAWQTNISALVSQNNWHLLQSDIWGRINRP